MSNLWEILVAGIVYGSIYAIPALGLVVTYSTTGVFNFSYGAIGMVCCCTYWELAYNTNHSTISPLVALLLVLLVEAPLLGIIIEKVFMRRLHGATTARSLMVTLGILLILLGIGTKIWGTDTITVTPPTFRVDIGGVYVSEAELLAVGVAIVIAGALWWFFRHFRVGIAMRAVVDDPELLAMAGARPIRISRLGWILGCMLAGLGGILVVECIPGGGTTPNTLTLVFVNCFAAAVVGRMRSLPLTFLGAIVLGIAYSYVSTDVHVSWLANADLSLPMILLFVVLLLLPQDRLRAIGRPPVSAAPGVVPLKRSLTGSGIVVILSILAAVALSGTLLTTVATGLVFGLIALSLVLLTGYAGQVSLCQLTFVGIGSFAMGHVYGGGSWLGVLAAVGLGAACGAIIALPTLRLRGLYMALATLAFAQAAVAAFFSPYMDSTALTGIRIRDLGFFGLDVKTAGGQLVIYGVLFAIASALVLAIRRSTFGRRLVGLSDSPAACATVGLNVKFTRLAVFAMSAGLAALGGCLYGNLVVNSNDFQLFISLELLMLLVIFGVRSVTGALLAGISLAALELLPSNGGAYFLVGIGIVLIGWLPNGVLGIDWFGRGSPVRKVIDMTSRTREPVSVGSVDAA
ncbi:MAG: ABC transporter permease [Acidimicrobiales bacterium]